MARGKKGGHPAKRPTKQLRVIPAPPEGTRSVLMLSPGGHVLITGDGSPRSTDYACGNCGRMLIEGLSRRQQVTNLVLLCPDCGAHNETGGVPEFN